MLARCAGVRRPGATYTTIPKLTIARTRIALRRRTNPTLCLPRKRIKIIPLKFPSTRMTIRVKMPARWCQCTSDASSHWAADKTSADRNPDAATELRLLPWQQRSSHLLEVQALYELPDA